MTRFWVIFPLLLFIAFTAVLAARLVSHNTGYFKQSPLIGKDVPSFSLPSAIDGDENLDNNEFKGRFSAINIFASWCISCRYEHEHLMALSKIIPIYGIDWKDEKEDLKQWLDRWGNPYKKIGFDKNGEAVIALGVTGAPETFIINEEGKIIFRYPGPIDADVIKNEIMPRITTK